MLTYFKRLPILLLVLLASCAGKETEEPMTAVASIVTYESTDNGISTFSYSDNKDDLITLTANWNGNEDISSGARALIYYTAEEYGVSGPISLLSVTRIPGGEPKIAATNQIPKSEPMQQCSIWRSGNYLNLSSVITFEGQAAEVSLYIDEATVNLQIPSAHIVVAPEDYTASGVERHLYASWNIADILSAPNFEGLKVYYTNTANQPTEIKITL